MNQRGARIGQRANSVIMMKENTSEFENRISEIELGMKQEVWRESEYWKCSGMLGNGNVAMTDNVKAKTRKSTRIAILQVIIGPIMC